MTTQEKPDRANHAAYMRAWRAAQPDKAARVRAVTAARNRALRRLAELHPDDMQQLYSAELHAAGLA